ncbi:hypothetical protein PENSPDRAFT_576544 [Peniophora sp. CONT]|nr:hypothetical protein PENSPDRAFT_576544 [Peniophora sp. CONT]
MSIHCRRCDETFLGEQEYGIHKRDSARHDSYCWHCDEDFDFPALLEEHNVQSPRHAFCQFCKKHFQSRQSLESHWEDCHYWCAGHHELFAKEALLKTHQLIDHNHCPQCNLFFRSVSHLDAHLASRRHEGALVMCPGDDCGRTFIKASELLQHFASETCFPYEAGV